MKILKKLLCVTLALSLCFGIYSLLKSNYDKAYAEEESQSASLNVSLNVGQNIALKAIAALPSGASGVKATFNWNDGVNAYSQTIESSSEDYSVDGNTYIFAYRGITPEYMDKVVNISVEYNDGEVLTGSLSIKGYLESLLATKPDSVSNYAYEYLKTLAYDLLDYGSSAQSYKGETDSANLVNKGTENGNTFSADLVSDNYTATTVNVNWSAGARYDYSVKPIVKFTLKNTSTATNVYAKVKLGNSLEKQVTVENVGDNGYVAVLDDFDLLKADELFTVTAYADDVALDSFTTNFANIAKKVYSYTSDSTSVTSNIIVATYVYAKSAIAYDDAKSKEIYVFEAEDAVIEEQSTTGNLVTTKGKESGCSTTPSGGAYVYKLSQSTGTKVIFKINAENDCNAQLIMTMGHNKSDNKLSSLFNVYVNDDEKDFGDVVFTKCVDGEVVYYNWRDTDIGTITLKKGVNTIIFEKTNTGLNFDCIKLVSDVKLEKVTTCTEHSYSKYINRKYPTDSEKGAVWAYCEVCGSEKIEELPTFSTENGYTYMVTEQPSDDTNGKAEWSITIDGQEFKFSVDLPDTRTQYVFEAEEAILYSKNGKTAAKSASTASGGRYIDNMGNDGNGSSLTWKINAESACVVNISAALIRHASDTRKVDDFFKITVNGTQLKTGVTINSTGASSTAWTTFYEFDILKNVNLVAGENVIVFEKVGSVLNLDYIKIYSAKELAQTEKELKIEAENCTLSGATTSSESNSNNPSGGKYVGGLGTKNRTITFTVTATKACTAKFILCYGNRKSISDAFTTRFSFTLNGNSLSSDTVSNKSTPDWFGWEEYVICEVDLVAGDNTIVITTLGTSGTSNIDYFKLISSESLTFKNA